MQYYLDIQHASDLDAPVTDDTLYQWVCETLKSLRSTAELTLRLVNTAEISHLNKTYRQKEGATNVLAFPATYPDTISLDYPFLGDIIICPDILAQEARSLDIPLTEHWAHIVIHGVLHLLGYDHIKEDDATLMQTLEIKLLAELGFANPYEREDSI